MLFWALQLGKYDFLDRAKSSVVKSAHFRSFSNFASVWEREKGLGWREEGLQLP